MSTLAEELALDRIDILLTHSRTLEQVDQISLYYLSRDLSLPERSGLTAAETLDVLRATASAARVRERELFDRYTRPARVAIDA